MKSLTVVIVLVAIVILYLTTAPNTLYTDNPHLFPHVATVVISQQIATKTPSQANRHK